MSSKRIMMAAIVAAAVIVAGAGVGITLYTVHSAKQSTTAAIQSSKLLGVSYNRIVSEFGKPTTTIQNMKNGIGMYMFQKGKITVSFMESKSYQVNYSLGKQPLSIDEAKTWINQIIPSDSTLVKSRTGTNHQTVLVYMSRGLSTQFGQEVFSDQNGALHPGYFDVSFVTNKDHKVTEMDLNVGDNA